MNLYILEKIPGLKYGLKGILDKVIGDCERQFAHAGGRVAQTSVRKAESSAGALFNKRHDGGRQVGQASGSSRPTQQPKERERKVKIPGLTGKEGAKNPPSWAMGESPYVGENGKEFAKRLCDAKFGKGNYDKGTSSDFNRIKKYGDRSFENPQNNIR